MIHNYLYRNAAGNLTPPDGYEFIASQDQTVLFNTPTDVAYGANGKFAFRDGVIGAVKFGTEYFGDPMPYYTKAGFIKSTSARPTSGATGGTGVSSVWLWVGGIVIVGGLAAYFIYKKKK
jgi:hypothetical protein